jgi:hypothetical protein
MINQLNKHMNHLSIKKNLIGIESIEHGRKITKKNLMDTEKKEHGLKKKPTMSQLLGMERKEHLRNGKIVIKKEY